MDNIENKDKKPRKKKTEEEEQLERAINNAYYSALMKRRIGETPERQEEIAYQTMSELASCIKTMVEANRFGSMAVVTEMLAVYISTGGITDKEETVHIAMDIQKILYELARHRDSLTILANMLERMDSPEKADEFLNDYL